MVYDRGRQHPLTEQEVERPNFLIERRGYRINLAATNAHIAHSLHQPGLPQVHGYTDWVAAAMMSIIEACTIVRALDLPLPR